MCSSSTSDVRFITFVNITIMKENGLDRMFNTLLKIEVGFLIFSWIEFIYLFYLFVFIRAMHFNLTCLFMNYGGQYFCSMFSRCLIVYQQLGNDPNNNLQTIIFIANYVRTIGLFIALYILPIFMLERCLASFFVREYEKSRKIWVSIMILSVFHPLVFASAIAYIQCWLPLLFHITSFFIVNIVGYIGIHICYRYNTKRHRKTLASKVYRLSERFQLAENIKMCKVLKKVQISIIFFNIGSCSILSMDQFDVEPTILYFSYISFNFFALIYGITVPVILYSCLPEWQNETRRLLQKLRGNNMVSNCPRTTYGEQMIYKDHKKETHIYFANFDKNNR